MKSMSFDQFNAWVETQSPLLREQAFFGEEDHFPDEVVRFHKGDLVTDELLVSPVTVIHGDLTAKSITHDYDVGLLVVTGNLNVSHIDPLTISIVVGGNLNAKSVCADSLNDYYLFVGGDIVCDFFAELGCYVEVYGKIVCPRVWNTYNTVIAHRGIQGKLIKGIPDGEEGKIVVTDVLDDEGYLDRDKLIAFFHAGKSPYLN